MNYFRDNRCNGLFGGEGPASSGGHGVIFASRKMQGLGGSLEAQTLPGTTADTNGAGLSVRCFWSPAGKLLRKEERGPLGRTVWAYSFDDSGHLLEARKGDIVVERYVYDEAGRRVADQLGWIGKPRQFIYYHDGSLIRLDDEYFAWTEKGQLKAIYDRSRRCEFAYGTDTRLDCAFLPSGRVVAYEYGKELMPVRVSEDSEPVAEYEWEDLLRLIRYIDIRNGLVYTFSYGRPRVPQAVTITGKPDVMEATTGIRADRLTLHIGVDQVDSIRMLATPERRLVKYVEYDSFGNVTRDTRPKLRFPLGFACGLNDAYTGFVRFGFRDYHPLVGRFTATDPVGYTGGDNDLWDYCVDDPVSLNDPTGLNPLWGTFGKFLLGKAGSLGLGLGGAYGAAAIVDKLSERKNGKKSDEAKRAVMEVSPWVTGTQAASSVPGALTLAGPAAAGAFADAGAWAGAAMASGTGVGKALELGVDTARFLEGYLVPGPPRPGLIEGAGFVARDVLDKVRHQKNTRLK